jgi:hypothetical protein
LNIDGNGAVFVGVSEYVGVDGVVKFEIVEKIFFCLE